MLQTILETIEKLEHREQLSKDDKELLGFLHTAAWKEIQLDLVYLISYGDRLGWEKIEIIFTKLLHMVQQAKTKS